MNIRRAFSPQAFARLVLAVAGLWLLVVYPALNGFCRERLPHQMRGSGSDFGQYYAGALAVRHGLWPHLYPRAIAEVYARPPEFQPLLHTFLFRADAPETRLGNWAYYPQIAGPAGGTVDPEVLQFAPQLQEEWHYIYPPPLAILLWPLSFLDYATASYGLWFWLMSASFFGMAWCSAAIFRCLNREPSYAEGLAALIPVLPTFLGSNMSTALSLGNVSPFLGFLIAGVTWAWLRNRQALIAVGIILLVLFKGIGLAWCVLLLLRPIKWVALAVLAALTVVLSGAALCLGGFQPYVVFFQEVIPKASIPLGTGVQGELMNLLGVAMPRLFLAVSLLLTALLLWGCVRASFTAPGPRSPGPAVALFVGTMALFCLFNPVVWPHYYSNYVLFPFAGWMLWEARQATGAWRTWTIAMLVLNAVFFLDGLFLLRDSWLMEWLQAAGHYHEWMGRARLTLNGFVVQLAPTLECCFLLLLACRRLFFPPRGEGVADALAP